MILAQKEKGTNSVRPFLGVPLFVKIKFRTIALVDVAMRPQVLGDLIEQIYFEPLFLKLNLRQKNVYRMIPMFCCVKNSFFV